MSAERAAAWRRLHLGAKERADRAQEELNLALEHLQRVEARAAEEGVALFHRTSDGLCEVNMLHQLPVLLAARCVLCREH